MTRDQKNLYLLLSYSNTVASRIIQYFTNDDYTHCSLGFDRDCTDMYSFARLYRHFILPGGFVREDIRKGILGDCTGAPCALLGLRVNDEIYEKVKNDIGALLSAKKRPSYDVLGVFRCYRGKESEDSGKYFCSHFAAKILGQSGAITLKKPASLYRPADFLGHAEFEALYIGTVGELRDIILEQKFQPTAGM